MIEPVENNTDPAGSTATPTPEASPTATPTPAEPTPTPTSVPEETSEAEPAAPIQTVDELIAVTEDPDWGVRWDAVNALGELGDPRGVPALVARALYDENPHPRWQSLWALSAVDQRGTPAVPGLLEGLEDSNPIVVRNAAVALAFFARHGGIPELVRGLEDSDDFRRWEAVFSLGGIPGAGVTEDIIPRFFAANESDDGVRGEAALALGRLGGEGAIPALLTALQSDSQASVRLRSAMSLARIGDPSVLEDLRQALEVETDDQVREFIQDAIADPGR